MNLLDLSEDRLRRHETVLLVLLCVFALTLRTLVVLFLPSVHFADEIFQSVEQAHRLCFGYGIVPWEFREGARSPLLPWALAGVMCPAGRLWGGPEAYMIAVRPGLEAADRLPMRRRE